MRTSDFFVRYLTQNFCTIFCAKTHTNLVRTCQNNRKFGLQQYALQHHINAKVGRNFRAKMHVEKNVFKNRLKNGQKPILCAVIFMLLEISQKSLALHNLLNASKMRWHIDRSKICAALRDTIILKSSSRPKDPKKIQSMIFGG